LSRTHRSFGSVVTIVTLQVAAANERERTRPLEN
jgi:hypothetical protein